jgi:hypothetical protein
LAVFTPQKHATKSQEDIEIKAWVDSAQRHQLNANRYVFNLETSVL